MSLSDDAKEARRLRESKRMREVRANESSKERELRREKMRIYDKKTRAKKKSEDPEGLKEADKIQRIRDKPWAKAYRSSEVGRAKSRVRNRAYHVKRMAECPSYVMEVSLRARFHRAFRLNKGLSTKRTLELIGCSVEFLKAYLISKMPDGMTEADMFSKRVHIDHIRPVCSFDLLDVEQQNACWHYTNLQPLWAEDNRAKGNKIDE